MSVKELIDILSNYNENLDVVIKYYNENNDLTKCYIQEDDIYLDNIDYNNCIVIEG